MKFSIIPLYFGKRTKVYTIQLESEELSEYEKFVYKNHSKVPNAVRNLDKQLNKIANTHGIVEEQFKRESPPENNVFRIDETKDWLRLYCIKYSRVAIVIGDGGIKKPKKYKLDQNPELLKKVNFLITIDDAIMEAIKSGTIKITDEGLEGELFFEI